MDIQKYYLINIYAIYSIFAKESWIEFETTLMKDLGISQGDHFNIYQDRNIVKNSRLFVEDKRDNEKIGSEKLTRFRLAGGGNYFGCTLNGSFHGFGYLSFADGSRYKGYFKYGKMNGKGYYYGNEVIIKGIWKCGRLDTINFIRLIDI